MALPRCLTFLLLLLALERLPEAAGVARLLEAVKALSLHALML